MEMATIGERCPVRFYKEFMRRRPDAMKDPEAPFFRAINHKRKRENPVWYQKSAVGKKSANFSQKQRKTQESKATLPIIIALEKLVFLG